MPRTKVVSSFTIIKGAMISETYRTLACWDLDASKKQNLDRLRQENFIGASSATWLRDVAKVLNRRLDPAAATVRLSRLPAATARLMSGSRSCYGTSLVTSSWFGTSS